MNISPIDLLFKLETLQCHDTGRKKAEHPYLWNIFFKIDGQTLDITDKFRLTGEAQFSFSQGSHGNIIGLEQIVSPGDILEIPPEVGEYRTTIHPMLLPYFDDRIPGVVACLSVMMVKKNLSPKGAEAGHKFLNDFVRDAINKALMDFDPKKIDVSRLEESVEVYFEERVLHYTTGLEGKMAKVIMKSQNIFQNIWTIVDKDFMVGFEIIDFGHDELAAKDEPIPFDINWRSPEAGRWEMKGFVRELKDM